MLLKVDHKRDWFGSISIAKYWLGKMVIMVNKWEWKKHQASIEFKGIKLWKLSYCEKMIIPLYAKIRKAIVNNSY